MNLSTYKEIKEFTKDCELPFTATNDEEENVIIEHGREDDGLKEHFYKITTAQKNGWLRINIYWEDGTTEEMYEK